MTDLEKYLRVREDAMDAAGISLTLRGVVSVLDTLARSFSEDFEIAKACDALDQMIGWASLFKKNLQSNGDLTSSPM